MSDVLTPAQRRRCMSAIRARDTGPELIVRRLCHALGYRFRLHAKDLPGRPDLVFPGRRKVIFVHGCFWHRHRCRYGRATPRTRAAFWQAKFQANRDRDRRVARELRSLGWGRLVVWECQLRQTERLAVRLRAFLGNAGSE